MIILDADVLIVSSRYYRDPRFAANETVLNHLGITGVTLAITSHTLLEVVGVLSFNSTAQKTAKLPERLVQQYKLHVVPDPQQHPEYSGCTLAEILHKLTQRMSVGDAVTSLQISQFAAGATCLLSWNAKHFRGKLPIPAWTPEEWWALHQPPP